MPLHLEPGHVGRHPSSSSALTPTLVFGVGAAGLQVLASFRPLLAAGSEAHSIAILVHENGQPSALGECIGDLLSASRIDSIESLGFEVAGRNVGQPIRVFIVAVIDLADATAIAEAPRSLASIAASASCSSLAVVIGAGALEDITDRVRQLGTQWDVIVPFVTRPAAGGIRTPADLHAMALCLVAAASQPGTNELREALLGARGGAALPAIVRVDAAMIEAHDPRFLGRVASFIQSRLLRAQFADPLPYEPASSYRAELPTVSTTLCEDAQPTRLAERLLRDVPFRLALADGGGRVSLIEREIIVEPYSGPRRQWVASLFRLRQYLDFSKGAEWRRRIENERLALEKDITDRVGLELAELHSLVRGPDRVLVWARELLDRLGRPLTIEAATALDGDFDEALDRLRVAIAAHPPTAALLARVAILAMLGARAGWTAGGWLAGQWGAAGAAILVVVVAAVLGARAYEREHREVTGAMGRCISALVARYEAATATNVRGGVESLVRSLRQRLERELRLNTALCEEATGLADDLMSRVQAPGDEPTSVFLDQLVQQDSVAEYLDALRLPWEQLQRAAATRGAFRPRRESDLLPPRIDTAALSEHVAALLRNGEVDVSFQRQLTFVGEHGAGFSRLVSRLAQRVMAGSGGAGARDQVFWLAPAGVLQVLSPSIADVLPAALLQPAGQEILACLRVSPTGVKKP